MNLDDLSLPATVIDSANFVMERAREVSINGTGIDAVATLVRERLSNGIDSVEDAFGTTGTLEGDVNLVFFETVTNFYFWAQNDAHKWRVEFDGQQVGGWYGLSRAYYRAVQNGIPVHDAEFMSGLTIGRARDIFRSVDGQPIPLLEVRVNNIVEAAQYLLAEHGGSAHKFVESCGFSAPKISETVVRMLPGFRDGAMYHGRWVWILKRAQILANDLSQLTLKYPEFVIHDIDQLTAFADYRLPQVLRHHGVLQYSDRLADAVDSKRLLPSGSVEEIEIRMATIKACEMLKSVMPEMTTAQIDVGLWLLSQDMRKDPDVLPHHYTVSSYY